MQESEAATETAAAQIVSTRGGHTPSVSRVSGPANSAAFHACSQGLCCNILRFCFLFSFSFSSFTMFHTLLRCDSHTQHRLSCNVLYATHPEMTSAHQIIHLLIATNMGIVRTLTSTKRSTKNNMLNTSYQAAQLPTASTNARG